MSDSEVAINPPIAGIEGNIVAVWLKSGKTLSNLTEVHGDQRGLVIRLKNNNLLVVPYDAIEGIELRG